MFTVKWVKHRYERLPIEVETSHSQWKLSDIREKHPMNPPDGFLVFDEAGNELRRWFASERPHA
jgi:hypothetical protein